MHVNKTATHLGGGWMYGCSWVAYLVLY